jgi:hypothetical protein
MSPPATALRLSHPNLPSAKLAAPQRMAIRGRRFACGRTRTASGAQRIAHRRKPSARRHRRRPDFRGGMIIAVAPQGREMPEVSIQHACSSDAPEAFSKLKHLLETDADLHRLDPGGKCTFQDGAMTGQLTTRQFIADVAVKPDGAGSVVSVSIALPFYLAPLRKQILQTLQRKLKNTLP